MAGALITLTTVGVAHHYRGRRLGEQRVRKEKENEKRGKEDGIYKVYLLLVSLICCIRPKANLRKHTLT